MLLPVIVKTGCPAFHPSRSIAYSSSQLLASNSTLRRMYTLGSATRPSLAAAMATTAAARSNQYDYDFIAIGAGSAGTRASRRIAEYGGKVHSCGVPRSCHALLEQGHPCIPAVIHVLINPAAHVRTAVGVFNATATHCCSPCMVICCGHIAAV